MFSRGGITRKIDWSHQKDIGSEKRRHPPTSLREISGREVDVGVKPALMGSNHVEST
jgi:hypothetical protein